MSVLEHPDMEHPPKSSNNAAQPITSKGQGIPMAMDTKSHTPTPVVPPLPKSELLSKRTTLPPTLKRNGVSVNPTANQIWPA
jgi:hypothetical protein